MLSNYRRIITQIIEDENIAMLYSGRKMPANFKRCFEPEGWSPFLVDVKRFLHYQIAHANKEKDSIIICTPGRSGTHYLMYLLINYLCIEYESIKEPVPWQKIWDEPNRTEYLYNRLNQYDKARYKKNPDNPVSKYTQYNDLIMGHSLFTLEYTQAKKIIFLYRDPFDWVSLLPELQMPKFIAYYMFMKWMNRRYPDRTMRLNYEALVRHPEIIFPGILTWLDIPIIADSIDKAIQFSTKDSVKKQQKTENKLVRDGRVGFGKQNMSPYEQSLISGFLEKYGVTEYI